MLAALIEIRELSALDKTSPLIRTFEEEAGFVDSIFTSDPEEIAPVVWTVPHSMRTSSLVVIVPAELLVKLPELHLTVIPDTPLIAALTVTLLPVEVKVKELDEFGDAKEFETVMVPADSTVVEKDCMWVWRSVFRIFATPLVEDSKLPLTNTPFVVPDEVMFTDDAI